MFSIISSSLAILFLLVAQTSWVSASQEMPGQLNFAHQKAPQRMVSRSSALATDVSGNSPSVEIGTAFITSAKRAEAVDAVTDKDDSQTLYPSLWDRLNSGYRLGNLEEMPGRVEQFELEFAKHPHHFKQLTQQAKWFLYYIIEEVEKRGMPAEVALIPAIESAFQPDAVSHANAVGIWQLIESTGRRFGLRQDWWMDARRDLAQSTRAALDYLDFLSKEFNGNWELTLAAYNAGEGAVRKQIRLNRQRNLPTSYAHLKLTHETRSYVPRLMALRNILRNPEKHGIILKSLENRPLLQVVDLKFQTDISVAAQFTSLSHRELKYFNLGYKRGVTPPNGPHLLAVPKGEVGNLVAKLDQLSPVQRILWAHHKVRPGEYLGKIAQLHGVTTQSIRQANNLHSNLIHPGQELRVPLISSAYQYAGPTWSSNLSEKRLHLVQSGDSLWKISRIYDVKLADLLLWNQLSMTSILHPGQSIIIHP